jgi:hypothetical protein
VLSIIAWSQRAAAGSLSLCGVQESSRRVPVEFDKLGTLLKSFNLYNVSGFAMSESIAAMDDVDHLDHDSDDP